MHKSICKHNTYCIYQDFSQYILGYQYCISINADIQITHINLVQTWFFHDIVWPEPRTQPPKGRIQPPRYMSVLYTYMKPWSYMSVYMLTCFKHILLTMITWKPLKTMASPFQRNPFFFSPFFYRFSIAKRIGQRPTAPDLLGQAYPEGWSHQVSRRGRGETACRAFFGGSWYFLWCQKSMQFIERLILSIFFWGRFSLQGLVKTVGLSFI